MSRKAKRQHGRTEIIPAPRTAMTPFQQSASLARADSLGNIQTGLGINGRDKRMAAAFNSNARWLIGRDAQYSMWRQTWLSARIAETIPDHACRAWLALKSEGQEQAALDLQKRIDTAKEHVKDTWTWGRVTGGALMLLGVDDGRTPDLPIDYARIRALTYTRVVDRWEAWPYAWCDDPLDANFGEPSQYQVSLTGGMNTVNVIFHHERVIRFDGNKLPRILQRANVGWHDSVFERVFDALRDFQQSMDGASKAMADFALSVLAIKGLNVELDAPDGEATITNRLREFLFQLSAGSLAVIDSDGETFTRLGHTVTGLPDLLDRALDQVCGSAEIPRAILMGNASGNSRAGGATDERAFYDDVAGQMGDKLAPAIKKLMRIHLCTPDFAPLGLDVDDFVIELGTLWEMSKEEKAKVAKLKVEALQIAYTMGCISMEQCAVACAAILGLELDEEFVTALAQTMPEKDAIPPTTGGAPGATGAGSVIPAGRDNMGMPIYPTGSDAGGGTDG